MAKILCIETGTSTCSVALCENLKPLAIRENHEVESNHSKNLALFIQEVLDLGRVTPSQLNAVAVSMGPGSYTGLRIGVSTAKGICYASNIPLIAINSLTVLAQGVLFSDNRNLRNDFLICPTIDARRMEVYTALFNKRLEFIEKTNAHILDSNSFSSHLAKNKIVFAGNGALKASSVISHPNALFELNIKPSARFMIPLAQEMFEQNKFEDVAYFEPYYLKDFVAKMPTKNVLGNA